MDEWLQLTKALSDENRLRALLVLQGRELCACRIIELLNLAPSTVSAHMGILHQAGLVEVRKDGRWRHYRQARRLATPLAKKMLSLARKIMGDDRRIVEDRERMQAILDGSETCAV